MEWKEAKMQFIAAWGSFGSNWGINRTMAQIHALLLVSPDPLNADDIMATLSISRGNANMNIRELINWGLLERVIISGERKEFFQAEKDIWKVARIIVRERKKREMEPMLRLLDNLDNIKVADNAREGLAFTKVVHDIRQFSQQANRLTEAMLKAEENRLFSLLIRILK